MQVWEKSTRRPIKYTELPEVMCLADLQLQLRGVVLGDNSHFVSLVLVNDNWLWYDGIGQKLQVFSRNDSKGQLPGFSCSLMFYEVTPLNKKGEKLITGNGEVPPSPESDSSISLDLLAMERKLTARPNKSPHPHDTVSNDDSLSDNSDDRDSCNELLARATKLTTGSKKNRRRTAPLDSKLDLAQEQDETQVAEIVRANMKQNSQTSLSASTNMSPAQ
jgi:hypothetical protein